VLVVVFGFGVLVVTFTPVIVAVPTSRRQQGHIDAGVDGLDGGVVGGEVGGDVIDPRLEPLHPVNEEVGRPDRLADARPRLPAVAVLADRDQQLRVCRVARDRVRHVTEDEERRLRGRVAAAFTTACA
jgi:hypothetical protein